jgi:hypothetical protein
MKTFCNNFGKILYEIQKYRQNWENMNEQCQQIAHPGQQMECGPRRTEKLRDAWVKMKGRVVFFAS